jgi:hypothetical protein
LLANSLTGLVCTHIVLFSNALEELSVRAGIALNQKKVFHDIVYGVEDQEFENEYHALSAQVVSRLIHVNSAHFLAPVRTQSLTFS